MQAGPIAQFLEADHRRLDQLLVASERGDPIDLRSYGEFRAGLLRHIALEEKILMPAMRRALGNPELPHGRELRVDHGAIASLLVPSPSRELIGEIRWLLERHNPLEEGPDGLYALGDRLLADSASEILDWMRAYPAVPTAAFYDGPRAIRTAQEALRVSALQFEQKKR